ncbi:MAG: hypothetical protein FWH50_00730 [Coriobacteriia bacterium]|nr:hypothetical protein [Coriobacteriia bacterium]
MPELSTKAVWRSQTPSDIRLAASPLMPKPSWAKTWSKIGRAWVISITTTMKIISIIARG